MTDDSDAMNQLEHMWKDFDDNFPDGCVEVEAMYQSGEMRAYCSCDLHWNKSKGEEQPLFWRIAT